MKGNPVSRGIAIGNVYCYEAASYTVAEAFFERGERDTQRSRFEQAFKAAADELSAMIETLRAADDEKAAIFAAHQEILEDEEILEQIQEAIDGTCLMPEAAVSQVFGRFIEILQGASDPLFAERAADLRDVRNRLVRILRGEKERNLSRLSEPVIIVAHDLLPSDTATLDRANVLGIITEIGGATSHSAIIARGYGIPAVLGVEGAAELIPDGASCVLDGLEGRVLIGPQPVELQQYTQKRQQYLRELEEANRYLAKPAALRDGERIQIGLNVGSDAPDDGYAHCDFIGLFRSEFLYMQSDHMPTEEEQSHAYSRVVAHAEGRPVTLRTLDIGGDKTLDYFALPREENPFLGNRALRLCLANPGLFNTQLRAALRAAQSGPLQLMFPMVGTLDDIRAARLAVERAIAELERDNVPFCREVEIGIMIEIPAIAEMADLVVEEVDFASIGTNDLTQYLHAVDRMNAQIADYYQDFSPAVFRVLGRIISAFNAAGKPISVCGELGGDPRAAVVLAGLGLRKMSMSGSNIAQVKRALSAFTTAEANAIAREVCRLATQQEVLRYIDGCFEEKHIS